MPATRYHGRVDFLPGVTIDRINQVIFRRHGFWCLYMNTAPPTDFRIEGAFYCYPGSVGSVQGTLSLLASRPGG